MKPVSLILLAGMAVVGLALILSVATDHWLTFSNIHSGLWKYCTGDKCGDLKPGNSGAGDSLKAVRALMILAVILQVGMGVVALLRLLKVLKGNMMWLPVLICGAAAGGCAGLGLVVYAGKFKNSHVSYGWSYIVGWLGCVIEGVIVILTLVLDRSSD